MTPGWWPAGPLVKRLRYPVVIILPATFNGSSLNTRCTVLVAIEYKTGSMHELHFPVIHARLDVSMSGLASGAGQRQPMRWDAGRDKTPVQRNPRSQMRDGVDFRLT